MKVRVDQDGDLIDMERDDLPEIGEFCFQANSEFVFKITSIEWSESFGGHIVRTKKMTISEAMESRG